MVLMLLAFGCSTPAPDEAPKPVEAPAEPPPPAPAPELKSAEELKKDAAPAGASKKVFFVEPAEGATVKSPVKVVFGLEGMTLAPAGTAGTDSGHHHLIVDGEAIPAGTIVPKDATHFHFGKAETETTVELAKGPHTLTMQLADGNHASYGPEMSATIHVTAE